MNEQLKSLWKSYISDLHSLDAGIDYYGRYLVALVDLDEVHLHESPRSPDSKFSDDSSLFLLFNPARRSLPGKSATAG